MAQSQVFEGQNPRIFGQLSLKEAVFRPRKPKFSGSALPSYALRKIPGFGTLGFERHIDRSAGDRGARLLWIQSDAPCWQRVSRRRRWPPRLRGCLRKVPGKEELPWVFTKKAPFASISRRPVPASRCWSSSAED